MTWGSEPRRLTLEWLTEERRPERIEAASRCGPYGDRTSTHFCRRGSACDLHRKRPLTQRIASSRQCRSAAHSIAQVVSTPRANAA